MKLQSYWNRKKIEALLGKKLPEKAIVHVHKTGLVVCQDKGYMIRLVKRAKAKEISGHADYLKCTYCKKYDSRDKIRVRGDSKYWHHACHLMYEKIRVGLKGDN